MAGGKQASTKLWCFYYMQGEEGESMECLNAFNIDWTKAGGINSTGEKKTFTLRLLLNHFPPLLAWKQAYCESTTTKEKNFEQLPLNPFYHFRLRQKDSDQGFLWTDLPGREEDLDVSIPYNGNVIYLKVLPLQNCLDQAFIEESKYNSMQQQSGSAAITAELATVEWQCNNRLLSQPCNERLSMH